MISRYEYRTAILHFKRAIGRARSCARRQAKVFAHREVMNAAEIRDILAVEFNCSRGDDFFSLEYRPGELADDALMRLFAEERACHGSEVSDFKVVLIMAHG